MWKKQLGFVIAIFVVFLLLPAAHASAAPELRAKVSAGFDGKAKFGKGGPITVEIENNGTSAFIGDMVIDTQQSYESGVGEVFPIEIAAGETKTITFINPKMFDFNMYGMNTKSIFFYEGGWKKGKEIEHKGAQQITVAMYHDDTKIITAFTDNIDRLSAVKGVRLTNIHSTQLIDASKIASMKLPEEAAGWGPADIIVIDEYPIADLSATEQQALLNWVRSGGVIVFGGSDHVAAESGIFSEYLPLTVNGKKTIGPEVFNEWMGREDFDQSIPISTTQLNADSKAVYTKDDDILAAIKPLGKGIVLQTAFSVGDEPFSKMAGASAVWSNLLDKAEQTRIAGGMTPYYYDPMESLRWTIGNSNELFPSFKVSAPLLFGVIIFYIIIIIPVLYIILKRKDKREHAWWIIPSISVVVSVFIFAYGARDRIGQAQIQQTSAFDVNQDGSLSGYFVESILTNKSGDFVFSAPKETTMSTYTPYSMGIFGPPSMVGNSHKRALIERSATGSNLHLRDIGYWDVATVYGQTTLEPIGNFDIALTVKDKQLTGEITNNFPFSVNDLAIWSGNRRIKIGDLGPGETLKVNETLKTSTLIRKMSSNSMYMGPMGQIPSTSDDLMKIRKDSLVAFSGNTMNSEAKPVLIGYTDTKIVPIELENTKAVTDSLTMLSQAFTPKVEFSGSFTVDPEMMTMTILSEGSNMQAHPYGHPANMYFFNESSYIQTWQVPEELVKNVSKWNSMDISKIQNQVYALSIWNVKTNEFDSLESKRKLTLDSIGDFVTEDGKVMLKMEFNNNQHGNEAQAPEIKLHGEVKK
ncbi:cupredoxin domain-containing protein [Sporosarcina sp. ACRSL]|uniref:cupredoxin domain-containing protein n=1 Tax=Sporosarcina sp. ACRSL TaxID=2918215 RepID=UPI001EF726C1|nr:cupredoxin domain-containing protein [Sporosarcina sp. ACRSL]MCG7342704.1 cupredoxin domain-containing protein [Sporosarcina sp. ACRSL]